MDFLEFYHGNLYIVGARYPRPYRGIYLHFLGLIISHDDEGRIHLDLL